MPVKKVDIKTVMSWNPCEEYTESRVKKLFGRRDSMSVKQILKLKIPHEDKLWVVLREFFFTEDDLRLVACDFAEEVLPIFEREYPNDMRPRNAIKSTREYVAGECSAAARDAAVAAARAAAGAAAWDAAGVRQIEIIKKYI